MGNIFYSLGDLKRDIATNDANPLRILTEKIVKAECQLWNNFPDRLTNNVLLSYSLARGYYAGLCGGDSENSINYPPSCEPKIYPFGTYISKNLTYCNQLRWWRIAVGIPESLYVTPVPIINTDNNRWQIPKANGGFADLRPINEDLYNSDNTGDTPGLEIINREANQSCVNVTSTEYGFNLTHTKTKVKQPTDPVCLTETQYPPTSPPNIITNNENVVINNVVINLDISVKPEDDGRIGFPHFVYVNGVKVEVNLGGFVFSPTVNLDLGGGGGINENPDNTENPKAPSIDEDEDVSGTDSGEEEEEPPAIGIIEKTFGAVQSRNLSGLTNLLKVELSTVLIPGDLRTQWGVDAPDIYYLGWFEFKQGNNCYPRQYIHFTLNVFNAPSGADGFAYTLYNGCTASIKTYQIEG